MTDTTQTPAPAAARVTIDDVRTVLEGTDPNQTNASKVRAMLGNRGSFETIQKYLGTLRAELAAAAAPPVAADAVPALPTEAAQAMWLAAWTAAQVQTLTRSEKLAFERDAALLKLETMSQDLADQVLTMDEQSAQLERLTEDKETADLKLAAAINTLQMQQDQQSYVNDAALNEIEKLKSTAAASIAKSQSDAAHAAEIAESGRELMRQELARLTDQVGELKAALYKRAEAAPVVPVVVPSPSPSPAGN